MYTWLYISSKLCKSILYQSQKSFLCFSSPCLNLSCSQHYVIPSFQSWVKFYSFWHLGLAERESHTRTNWTAKFCENFENPLKSKYTQKTVCAVAWKSKAYFTFPMQPPPFFKLDSYRLASPGIAMLHITSTMEEQDCLAVRLICLFSLSAYALVVKTY